MEPSFLFYYDPGLTTPIRGSVMLTVDSVGRGADITLYFGSPFANRYCTPEAGQTIIISIDGDTSDAVDLALDAGAFVGAQSIDLGPRINGGVTNRIPLFFRAASAETSLSVTCTPLAEFIP